MGVVWFALGLFAATISPIVTPILVIANNLDQASYRLRIASLIEPLAAHGWKLEVHLRPRGLLARRRLLRTAAEYHAVILQRKTLDGFDARLLQSRARRVYFDVDDAVMFTQGNAGMLARRRAWRRFEATARHVSAVVAGNEYLADLFRREGAKALVLPTVVDIAHYSLKVHSATESPALVWIGSRSTLGYLSDFLPALGQAARRVPGLKLFIIADQSIADAPVPVEHIPWSVATEAASLCRGDIGIAPTPSDEWTAGKCGFKIVQYMAAGLPVIASPVGANSKILVAQKTGLLPETPGDWVGAIVELAQNPQLRAQMGAAARRRAEEEYSIERAVAFWDELLRDC
jgi:glycosyltransferase involved in cell wall biosynthesis